MESSRDTSDRGRYAGLIRPISRLQDLIPKVVLAFKLVFKVLFPQLDVLFMSPSQERNRKMSNLIADLRALLYVLLVAATCGFFVVVPILPMSFDPSHQKNLVTICIFVFLFACGLATTSKLSESGSLAITAIYAALLVVFVGQITMPSSLG